MKRILAAALILIGLTGIAAACPTIGMTGVSYNMSGDQLYSPQTLNVTAGGPNNLSNCGFNHAGYVISAPDFSFYLSGMGNYRLEIEVNGGNCDTMLLVNSANGTWFYDDDSNGNLQPVVNIQGGQHTNGRVDVWVGTYNGDYCNATLEMETWNN